MSNTFPDPGEYFERRYNIRRQVGSGGFARIYHAVQRGLERDVALKILKPEPIEDLQGEELRKHRDKVTDRFRREARNVAQLRDPHTITLFDFGRTNDNLLYMVFEYIDGQTLEELAQNAAPLPSHRIASILLKVLSSLEEAHARGMLHRDIKPANVMVFDYVGRTDQVKVLDFGIAKAVLEDRDVTRRNVTRDDMMMGTPRYMSPEQLRGEEIGPPSDFYSLGLVAYELVTGRKAIATEDTVETIERQIRGEPIQLPAQLEIDPTLRGTIDQLLAKRPDARFEDASEVMSELERVDGLGATEPSGHRASVAPQPDNGGSIPLAGSTRRMEQSPGEEADPFRETNDLSEDSSTTESAAAHAGAPVDDAPTERSAPPSHIDDEWGLETLGVFLAGFAGAAAFGLLIVWWMAPSQEIARTIPKTPGDVGVKVAHGDVEEITIETRPANAFIEINDQRLGRSPIRLLADRIEFPAALRAYKSDGSEVVRTVDRPRARILLELHSVGGPDVAASSDTDASDVDAE